MNRNDALDFAQRLYSRVPAHYRAFDVDQGLPLYALLTVVGEQTANIRSDLDGLWDNFFIETCEDWVVPYLGALAGTNLLTRSVGDSNRLDVWNTVQWRRNKGTPEMLESMARSISGWPAALVEFFQLLGWSQNMNHLRPGRLLTPDLRLPRALGLLNRAGDAIAHAADFHPAPPLAEPLGASGSQGRYNIRNLGFFVSRLQTFPVKGATPAASAPGTTAHPGNTCFTFNPLFRNAPLFSAKTSAPIRRSDLAIDPWLSFGEAADIAVRQFGVLLAAGSAPAVTPAASDFSPFSFGGAGAGLVLDASAGLRLMAPQPFQMGSAQFVITAQWKSGAALTIMGSLDSGTGLYTAGAPATGNGNLVIHVSTKSRSSSLWFPGAVVAVKAKGASLLRSADALYAYLPPALTPQSFDIGTDGGSFIGGKLARAAEGQVYPPRQITRSTNPATGFDDLHSKNGLTLADPARYKGAIQIQAKTGHGFLTVSLEGNTGVASIPPAELIVTNRAGRTLLVYLPEITSGSPPTANVFVGDDGSTYFVPTDAGVLMAAQNQHSLSGLVLARGSAGQVLPMPGWPLQQRCPVVMNLCNASRSSLLASGELGIDPELGRFALPPSDSSVAIGNFTVDYLEALSGPAGALNYDRPRDTAATATLVVDQSGDADTSAAVHTTLADAVASAREGDIIEIADSATYASAPIVLANAAVQNLTIRAAVGQRPCLLFYSAGGTPAASSLSVTVPMTSLTLNGLLLSGGPIMLESPVKQLSIISSSLDPEPGIVMIHATDASLNSQAAYVISACITGGISIAEGVSQLTVADSIVDAKNGAAIVATRNVQLERVTVLGSMNVGVLTASECLLNDLASVQDQQSGCVRFTRFEAGSVLPRRYLCIPTDAQVSNCAHGLRCVPPRFHSRRFGLPGYGQLAAGCASELLSSSESESEVGAFAGGLSTVRLANLRTKLREFMPVGQTATLVATT